MIIENLRIESFKRIESAEIQLLPINVIVGPNNSGKSSILQAIHFHVVAAIGRSRTGQGTFGSEQLTYKPCYNFSALRNGRPYGNIKDSENSSKLTIYGLNDENSKCEYEIEIRKGRNDGNISCTTKGDQNIGSAVANASRPFSIIVPGLAGIPIKEELRSKAVVLNAIASGESNLYLRNILLLIKRANVLDELIKNLKTIFPDFDLTVDFNDDTDLYINVSVILNGCTSPLELSGTGVLQALQIFAYIIMFNPRILLLDEPDSHLHPDNQKKLVEAILLVSNKFDTKILISTHSRYILDGLLEDANFIRLDQGVIVEQGKDLKRLSMLIDIGALDKYDRLRNGEIKCVILTEDSSKIYLEKLLEYNGFPMNNVLVVSYKSCTNMQATVVLVEFIKEVSSNCSVIIHRDSDFMLPTEKTLIIGKIEANGAIPYLTDNSDIEAYFTNPRHISTLLNRPETDIKDWLNEIALSEHVELQQNYSDKRNDLRFLYKDNPTDFPSTVDLLGKEVPLPEEKRKGKKMLKGVNGKMHQKFGITVDLKTHSPALVITSLVELRNKIFPK